MPRKANDHKDFGEITLAIGLEGGIVAGLLYVINNSDNQSLDFDPSLKPLVYGLIAFLLFELLIIFLFFIFKGISVYAYKSRKEIFEQIAEKLFKISFIIAFGCFIGSIMTVFLKLFYSKPIGYGFILIALVIGVITVAIFSTEIKSIIKNVGIIKSIIIIILFIILFFSNIILIPQYLLTGSYSIEEFSPSIDNPDMRTFTMKEKGISYNLAEVWLFKLNSSQINSSPKPGLNCADKPGLNCIDNVIIYKNRFYSNSTNRNGIYRNGSNAIWSDYIFGEENSMVWYINIINISNLSSGTYLLTALVKDEPNESSFGVSKRYAEKLFYIPPEGAKANYSFNRTQTS